MVDTILSAPSGPLKTFAATRMTSAVMTPGATMPGMVSTAVSALYSPAVRLRACVP